MHFDKNVYNSLLLALDSDSLSLDATLTLQGRARVDAASGVWVIGPGTIEYSLSTFLAVRPFLLQAARQLSRRWVDMFPIAGLQLHCHLTPSSPLQTGMHYPSKWLKNRLNTMRG
jgi:hypothetical protein